MDQNATLLVSDSNLLCINPELCEPEYTSVSIQAALEDLQKLKSVKKEEYKFKFLVKLRNEIFDWRRKYGDLSPNDRLQLLNFYEILRKRSAVVSLAGLEKIDERSSGARRKFMSCRRK